MCLKCFNDYSNVEQFLFTVCKCETLTCNHVLHTLIVGEHALLHQKDLAVTISSKCSDVTASHVKVPIQNANNFK